MARPVRRSVGSDLSSPTPSTEHLKSNLLRPETTDPLRTTTEHTYTTTHAIPKFNRYTNTSSKSPTTASSSSSPATISSPTPGIRGTTTKPYPTTTAQFDRNGKFVNISDEYNESNNTAAMEAALEAAYREKSRMDFYATYDVMTGVRIAATLGGFFGLMVFLVIYKSRSKSSHPLKALKVSVYLIQEYYYKSPQVPQYL